MRTYVMRPFNVPSESFRANAIRIPDTPTVIAMQESHKGLINQDALIALSKDGLYMPPIATFMQHYKHVLSAEQKNRQLYDGNGKRLPRQARHDLFRKLTSDYAEGTWTHLDGLFVAGSGFVALIWKPTTVSHPKATILSWLQNACLWKNALM